MTPRWQHVFRKAIAVVIVTSFAVGLVGEVVYAGQKAKSNRRVIPREELHWKSAQWQRSWDESVQEFKELPGVRHLIEGSEDIAIVRDGLDALGTAVEAVNDAYHEVVFDPLTEGMGDLTPDERLQQSIAETAAVTSTSIAVGATAGGALASTAASIPNTLTPALVTAEGVVLPATLSGAAASIGPAAGLGGATGSGLGIADQLYREDFKVTSAISEDPQLVRQAQQAGRSVQNGLDSLVRQLQQGNLNPGIGTKSLTGVPGVFYARHRNGARVFFRELSEDSIEIIGKASKHNEPAVISRIRRIYGH